MGRFEWNCGSTQVVKEYVEAGAELGIEICLSDLGLIDEITAGYLPITDSLRENDVLVCVFESDQFMDNHCLMRCLREVPRNRRIVIDTDGHNREISITGNDSNHRSSEELDIWREVFGELSDVILEPSLTTCSLSQQFLYFGMSHQICQTSPENLDWELGYIGNNWYRWADVFWIIREIEEVRHLIPRVGLRGKWWDQETLHGFSSAEQATVSDPHFLAEHSVDLGLSVPFGSMVTSMSRAVVHPILVRPILRHMHLVTPRMFETFASNAIPALAPCLEYTTALYGNDVRSLILSEHPAEQLAEMVTRPREFRELSLHIREKLRREHSYKKRITELLQFVE